LKKDVAVHKTLLRDSEDKRHEVQLHISQTAIVIHQDTDSHRKYQEQLIAEAEALKAEIQALKQHQARREQEHLHTVEDLNQSYSNKLDQTTNDWSTRYNTLSAESQARIDRLQRDNHDKLSKVTKDYE